MQARYKTVERFYNQKKKAMDRADIREKFTSGEYLASCMRLECVDFDPRFYEDLVSARRKTAQEPEEEAHFVEQQVLPTAPKKRRTSGRVDISGQKK